MPRRAVVSGNYGVDVGSRAEAATCLHLQFCCERRCVCCADTYDCVCCADTYDCAVIAGGMGEGHIPTAGLYQLARIVKPGAVVSRYFQTSTVFTRYFQTGYCVHSVFSNQVLCSLGIFKPSTVVS